MRKLPSPPAAAREPRAPARPKGGSKLTELLAEARACTHCAEHLPLGPRPVLRAASTARVLVVGQAPGRKVHDTGIPWNDPSGDLLREWLGIDRDAFYDERRIAIAPAGFCYPGKGASGDLPPRPECAPRWHPRLRPLLPRLSLTLLIGAYAQAYYLGENCKGSLADTVRARAEYLPAFFPLPHPSPRNRRWLRDRPWFAQEILPELRAHFRAALEGAAGPPQAGR
ncbi:MAG TPA: uracil-DNA glycosylase family protein [Burkholderiales bacterium]|nr:uracil-DNA glycosylase family protein [Burkholderiales bacterium]